VEELKSFWARINTLWAAWHFCNIFSCREYLLLCCVLLFTYCTKSTLSLWSICCSTA